MYDKNSLYSFPVTFLTFTVGLVQIYPTSSTRCCCPFSVEAVSVQVFGPVPNLEPFFSVSTDKEPDLGQERVVPEWQTAYVRCWGGRGYCKKKKKRAWNAKRGCKGTALLHRGDKLCPCPLLLGRDRKQAAGSCTHVEKQFVFTSDKKYCWCTVFFSELTA